MSLLNMLPKILEDGFAVYEAAEAGTFPVSEIMEGAGAPVNMLARGENLAFMKFLEEKKGLTGSLKLVYMDPPFFSKANYGTNIKLTSDKMKKIPTMKQIAYNDRWEEGLDTYLTMLCARFYMIRQLLAEDGCLWVHLDWHAVHYVKVLLDEVFGEKQFVNEIIWNYKSGGTSKKHFSRKHDTLLFYSKTKDYYYKPQQEKSYNRGYKPYRFKGVKEYKDEAGWYTMVNMKDVWQIDMVGRTSAERTGYVTQKPEALLARILESCTREGDLCADFFGGAGTLAAAAEKMKRRWISCDIGRLAVINSQKRMAALRASFQLLEQKNDSEACGDMLIKLALEPLEFTDKMLLQVKLLSYRPASLDKIPVDEKNKAVIQKIIKEDSLQLVDYWSIDYNYDGAVHRAEDFSSKEKDRIQTFFERTGPQFSRISIRLADIFGNSLQKEYRVD